MKRRELLLVIVFCGALLAVILFALAKRNSPSRVLSPDGGVALLQRVRFGTNDQFVAGTPLQRLAFKILPQRLHQRLRIPVLSRQSSEKMLFVWVELAGITNWPRTFECLVSDDHGLQSFPAQAIHIWRGSNATAVLGFQFSDVPRHATNIGLHLYRKPDTSHVAIAEFRLPNPAFTNTPRFAMSALPVTQRDGDADFALLAAHVGLQSEIESGMGRAWSEFVFRIDTNEPVSHGMSLNNPGAWIASEITLTSDAGNRVFRKSPFGRAVQIPGNMYSWRQDEGVISLPGTIWPDETWKMRVKFERSVLSRWPPELMFSIGVPFVAGATNDLSISNQLHGTTFYFTRFGAARDTNSSVNAWRTKLLGTLVGRVDSPDRVNDIRLLQVVDQRGSNVFRIPTAIRKNDRLEFRVGADPGTTSLDLTFGILRSYSAEFIVRPTILRTNLAHWPVK